MELGRPKSVAKLPASAGVLLVASLVGSEEQAAEEESPFIYTLEPRFSGLPNARSRSG